MTGTFTLNRLFRMSIRLMEDGLFSIAAEDGKGLTVAPDELVSFLFFNNERALYGLLANMDDEVAYLQADQLLQVFSVMHPYVTFEGLTDEDDTQLASIREAANAWTDPNLWNYAEVDGTLFVLTVAKRAFQKGLQLLSAKRSVANLLHLLSIPNCWLHCYPIYGCMAGRANPFPQCQSVLLSA